MLVPLLQTTGQSSKLKTLATASAIGLAAVTIAPELLARGHETAAVTIFPIGAAILLVSVMSALRLVRCPRCKSPWLQFALAENSVGGWLTWLTTFSVCPDCGLSSDQIEKVPDRDR